MPHPPSTSCRLVPQKPPRLTKWACTASAARAKNEPRTVVPTVQFRPRWLVAGRACPAPTSTWVTGSGCVVTRGLGREEQSESRQQSGEYDEREAQEVLEQAALEIVRRVLEFVNGVSELGNLV